MCSRTASLPGYNMLPSEKEMCRTRIRENAEQPGSCRSDRWGLLLQENGETLRVFDAKRNLVGRFTKVEEWYVSQTRPNKE